MNERIQELLVEAHRQTKGGIYSGNLTEWTEKFAELILKECVLTVENAENGYQDYRNQIEDNMRDHCVWLIKNKFGIEE